MSAPSEACSLARYVGEMLIDTAASLNRHGVENGYGNGGARVRVEVSLNTSEPFHVYIDEALQTFHGMSDSAGDALLKANSKRQAWYERRDSGRDKALRVSEAGRVSAVGDRPWNGQ